LIGMVSPERTLRVLPFNRDAGPAQLAYTEAVIDAVGQGEAPPTLRLYSWSRDSLIIGVGQPASQINLDACREADCEVLRRISGGTAVFHDGQTVSFQMVLPAGHHYLTDDIHVNYRRIADIAVSMLASFGVESRWVSLEEARASRPPEGLDGLCFASLAPFEVVTSGRKLVGLAQVKRRTVSALQGMVYLRHDVRKSVRLVERQPDSKDRLADVLASRTTDLNTAAGRDINAEEVADRFRQAVLQFIDAAPVDSPLTDWELQRARELEETRYRNPEWTYRR
jgi:lipoate-protein ligase A